MTVISSPIMKYHRNFFTNFKVYVAFPVTTLSIFTKTMTMISNFIISNINQPTANPTILLN